MIAVAAAAVAVAAAGAAYGQTRPGMTEAGLSPQRVLTRADGLPHDWIKGLFVEGDSVWISAGSERSGGIAVYDLRTGSLAPFGAPADFDGRILFGVARFGGKLFFGTDAGIFRTDGAETEKFEAVGRLSLRNAQLAADGDRHLYALSKTMYGGLFRFDGTKWEPVALPAGEGALNNGTDLLVAGADDLLIATTDRGIWRYKGGAWTRYGRAEGLPGIWVKCLAAVGKRIHAGGANGLAAMDGGKWRALTVESGGGRIDAIEAAGNRLFAGTAGKGLAVIGDGEVRTIDTDSGLSDNRVTALVSADGGRLLFVGTVNGLNILTNRTN
jgi:ligand-binding sensor domain-containing protein